MARIKGMNKDEVKITHNFQQLLEEIEGTAGDEPLVIEINGGDDRVLD